MNSTLKIQTPEAITLIEKIKAELKKRAELKAKRIMFGGGRATQKQVPRAESAQTAGKTLRAS